MGFLDHSTNNIIVDAVLTDRGRELLAGQNSNIAKFSITKFSLSDDEVDYTIIKKYGRTVGKEKIIKNTPIFEAQTKAYLAQKHRMISLSDPLITVLPSLKYSGTPAFVISSQAGRTQNITVETDLNDQPSIPSELYDSQYYVTIPSKLLSLVEVRTPIDIDESTALLYATYTVRTTPDGNSGASSAVIKMQARPSLDSTLLSVYGDSSNTINALITVVGASSGGRLDIPFTIKKN